MYHSKLELPVKHIRQQRPIDAQMSKKAPASPVANLAGAEIGSAIGARHSETWWLLPTFTLYT
jgi:hypothetical protein